MMRKHTAMALAAFALAMAAGSAQAEFMVQGSAQPSAAPQAQGPGTVEKLSAPTGVVAKVDGPAASEGIRHASFGSRGAGVREVGTPPDAPKVAKGFARSIPLVTALKQIVPGGWKARKSGDIDLNTMVSWRSQDQTWVEVLDTLAHEQNFTATVNWDSKELVISPAGGAIRETIEPARSQAPHDALVSQQGPANRPAATVREEIGAVSAPAPKGLVAAAPQGVVERPVAIAAPQPMPVAQVWQLTTDKTLRQNIEAWGKQAGWAVSWDAQMPDYPITVPMSLSGSLDSNGGPLYQIAIAYKDADQPFTIKLLKGNRTIRVEKVDYDQQPNQDFMPEHRASAE